MHAHIKKTLLSHTTLRLIFIRVMMDHKDGKDLPHNTAAVSRLELKTFD